MSMNLILSKYALTAAYPGLYWEMHVERVRFKALASAAVNQPNVCGVSLCPKWD